MSSSSSFSSSSSSSEEEKVSKKDDYNFLNQSPPNFYLAKIHGSACKVKDLDQIISKYVENSKGNPMYYCPCCQLPTLESVPQYDLTCNIIDLNDLGSGIPLYFYFNVYLGILCFIMSLLVGIPMTIIFAKANRQNEWLDGEEISFLSLFSIGSLGESPENYSDYEIDLLIGFGLATIILIYISAVLLKNHQSRVIKKIDENNITPGDFAIMLSNVPKDKTEVEIKIWIKSLLKEVEIENISIAYDIKQLVSKIKQCEKLKKALHNPKKPGRYDLEKLREDIGVLERDISQTKADMKKLISTYRSTGNVFVILNKQSQAEKLVSLFRRYFLVKIIVFIFIKIFRCNKYVDKMWWDGRRINIERAAEPTDVFWQNMSVTFWTRFKYRILSYAITIVLLGIAFGINFSLTMLSKSVEETAEKSDEEFIRNVNRFIALLRSIVVSIMNVVLKQIMLKLTHLERDNTFTKYNLSITLKYFVVTAINTVIIPVATNLDKETWFLAGGLVVEIFFNLVLLCFVTPLFYILNPAILVKKVKIFLAKRQGKSSKLNQRDLNQLYEGPALDVAKGYSEMLLIIAITVFYLSLVPAFALISCAGIIFHYWVKKYMLIRINKIPKSMGEDLAIGLNVVLPFIPILYATGQYYFVQELAEGENKFVMPIVVLAMMYYLLPVDLLLSKCENDISRDDNETYLKNKLKFLTDYDRSNPVTSQEATKRYQEMQSPSKFSSQEETKSPHKETGPEASTDVLELLALYGMNTSGPSKVNRIEGEIEGFKVNIQPRASKAIPTSSDARVYPKIKSLKPSKTIRMESKRILPSSTLRLVMANQQ
ncbi:unnamed protein product [Moneuplotes crassus]|uniref:CSC1/OSCA1-like cytosolic domain-containing protein n=1 Tax=Euplotes crassus TaxID=5936 RepID=A0AAD1Y2T4_EUPCR|nr:unnamed protein product [Moneuplotes crassus]